MEPDNIELYPEGLWRLYTLPPSTQKMLMMLLQRATSAECGMMIMLNSMVKSNLCRDLEVNGPLFNQRLRELEEIGMIRFKSRNLYEINPYMFGKGDWFFIYKLRKTWPECKDGEDNGSTC